MPIGPSRFSGPAVGEPGASSKVCPIGDQPDSRSRKGANRDSCNDSHRTPGTARESRSVLPPRSHAHARRAATDIVAGLVEKSLVVLEERAGKLVTKLSLPLALFLLPSALVVMIGPAGLQLIRLLSKVD